jgi:hypothetical protein
VNAYDFIASGCPVVLPNYSETQHFVEFAGLYQPGNAQEFESCVNREIAQRNFKKGRVDRFAMENTWTARVSELMASGLL